MMDEYFCVDCHELCLHCQGDGDNDASLCFCEALRAVHFEESHGTSKQFGDVDTLLDGSNPLDETFIGILGDTSLPMGKSTSKVEDGTPLVYPDIPHVDLNTILFASDKLPMNSPAELQVENTTSMDFENCLQLLSNDIDQGVGLIPEDNNLVQTSRRRDYTKEEKEEFEQWITTHPKPTKKEKMDYARAHCLTDSQVQNLINNRKRKIKSKIANLPIKPDRAKATQASQTFGSEETGAILEATDEVKSKDSIDSRKLPLVISEANMSLSLNSKPSYSSLEKFLKSPEESVPVELVHRAYQEFVPDRSPKYAVSIPDLPMPAPLSDMEQLDVRSVAKSCSSAGTARSHAHSASSNISRSSQKQKRREKRMKGVQCTHCSQSFHNKGDLAKHYNTAHSKSREVDSEVFDLSPNDIQCSYCNEVFECAKDWEEHETQRHCVPSVVWFCMLNHEFHNGPRRKCIFDTCHRLVNHQHYIERHSMTQCLSPTHPAPFESRSGLLNHLVDAHGISDTKTYSLGKNIDEWSLTINKRLECNLWQCGYCGIVGADWNNRFSHIKNHWYLEHETMQTFSNLDDFITGDLQSYMEDLELSDGKPLKCPSYWSDTSEFVMYKAYLVQTEKETRITRRVDNITSMERTLEISANEIAKDSSTPIPTTVEISIEHPIDIILATTHKEATTPASIEVHYLGATKDSPTGGVTFEEELTTSCPTIGNDVTDVSRPNSLCNTISSAHESHRAASKENEQPPMSFFAFLKNRTKMFLEFTRGRRIAKKKEM